MGYNGLCYSISLIYPMSAPMSCLALIEALFVRVSQTQYLSHQLSVSCTHTQVVAPLLLPYAVYSSDHQINDLTYVRFFSTFAFAFYKELKITKMITSIDNYVKDTHKYYYYTESNARAKYMSENVSEYTKYKIVDQN